MYDPNLSKVRFTGPLALFAPGWREVLVAAGYVPTSAAIKLQLAAHFSRWLGERGMVAWDVTQTAIDAFLVERRATHTSQISLEGLGPFLEYLRSLKVIPEVAHPLPVTEQEILMTGYQDYLLVPAWAELRGHRGL